MGVFALVGISVLEAVVVTFLSDLNSFCNQRNANKTVEIELDVGKHNGKSFFGSFVDSLHIWLLHTQIQHIVAINLNQ